MKAIKRNNGKIDTKSIYTIGNTQTHTRYVYEATNAKVNTEPHRAWIFKRNGNDAQLQGARLIVDIDEDDDAAKEDAAIDFAAASFSSSSSCDPG